MSYRGFCINLWACKFYGKTAVLEKKRHKSGFMFISIRRDTLANFSTKLAFLAIMEALWKTTVPKAVHFKSHKKQMCRNEYSILFLACHTIHLVWFVQLLPDYKILYERIIQNISDQIRQRKQEYNTFSNWLGSVEISINIRDISKSSRIKTWAKF